MTLLTMLFVVQAMAMLLFGVLYLLGRRYNDMGFVDVGWTTGIGIAVVFYAAALPEAGGRGWIVAALGAFWAFRLALFILRDRVIGREEDGRYQYLRAHWGAKANRNFFFFFEAQSLLVVLFSLPVLAALLRPDAVWTAWDTAGALVWAVAVGGELVADRQLSRFRHNPANRGTTCREGLWRYSRHPNYFFEWVHWFAYVLFAVGSPYFWLSLLGPAAMFLFLFKLTGIPYTEKQALRRRPDYLAYQQSTSVFFPWFPKKHQS